MRFKEEDIKYLACELPDEIKFYKFSGDFAAEHKAVAEYLKRDGLASSLRHRLEIEYVISREMQRDYLMTEEALLARVKERYPACTAEVLQKIVDEGYGDYIIRGGKKYFQRSATRNILTQKGRYLASLEDGVMAEYKRDRWREECIPIMKRCGFRAVRYTVREWIAPAEREVREGKKLRIHLPYPCACDEQSDIALNYSSHPVYISNSPHRTAFIEAECHADEKYEIEFSYTFRTNYVKADPAAVSAEQPSFYTGEQYPQIRFTPYIRALADELKGKETNPLILARIAYDYVTTNTVYSLLRPYLCIENIPEFVLLNHKGDCGAMALAFITLCRAMGVPARWQSGSNVRPDRISSHDWAQFYIAPYGWLYADLSAGAGAYRAGDYEFWDHYFGNIDTMREINCTEFQASFDPPKHFMRADPYDNQSGEIEYEDRGLILDCVNAGRSVVDFKDLTDGYIK
jgi:hypothetical protein